MDRCYGARVLVHARAAGGLVAIWRDLDTIASASAQKSGSHGVLFDIPVSICMIEAVPSASGIGAAQVWSPGGASLDAKGSVPAPRRAGRRLHDCPGPAGAEGDGADVVQNACSAAGPDGPDAGDLGRDGDGVCGSR